MILPFVRELLADLENSVPFERVRRHLSGGAGRRRVSGLTFTARALYLPFFVRAANAPCLIVVADKKGEVECPGTLPSVFCPGRQCPMPDRGRRKQGGGGPARGR